jgi:hypothetical protein
MLTMLRFLNLELQLWVHEIVKVGYINDMAQWGIGYPSASQMLCIFGSSPKLGLQFSINEYGCLR